MPNTSTENKLKRPIAASQVPARLTPSNYPSIFAVQMVGRKKHALGDYFGLKNFGVNLTELQPGARSSLVHYHTRQDEFIYVLEGSVSLILGDSELVLHAGMCCGFPAMGAAHSLINHSDKIVRYLEIGDRTEGDEGIYAQDDLQAIRVDGRWQFVHKDGRPYGDDV
jgi:uncharacterized cupin superfamily protein